MKEQNLRLILEYEGTRYHGWQRQKNAISVQEIFENAVKKITGKDTRSTAAGRTDAGVHARGQVVNIRIEKMLQINNIIMGLNTYLPDDIVVKSAEETTDSFHARFDAKKRVYQYYITLCRTALYRNLSWELFSPVDKSLLQPMADQISGVHDFSAFSRNSAVSENKVCQIFESNWQDSGEFLIYRITANRFLHGMVRGIVGTMIDVARGRFTMQQFSNIFHSCNRELAGTSAPAKGLFLEEVIYSDN